MPVLMLMLVLVIVIVIVIEKDSIAVTGCTLTQRLEGAILLLLTPKAAISYNAAS